VQSGKAEVDFYEENDVLFEAASTISMELTEVID
jgi:hypothetical protein